MKTVLDNLRNARMEVGSGAGTGDTYLKVNDKTGAITFGQEGNKLPPGRWVVGLHGFMHGYVDMQDGKVRERVVIPMIQDARPVPKGGSTTKIFQDPRNRAAFEVRNLGPGEYGTYEGGGPQDITEIVLNSLTEKGFRLTFTAWSKSSANRVGSLLEQAVVHAEGPDGAAGFVHPVIEVKASMYYNSTYRRDVYHFDFDIVDWLHKDSESLLSKHGAKGAIEDVSDDDDETASWDDGEEELTDEEREMLKAS
jgi:hypothetical protein